VHIQKLIFPLLLTLSFCIPAYATGTEGGVAAEPTIFNETPIEETPVGETTPEETPVEEVVDDETTNHDTGDYSGGSDYIFADPDDSGSGLLDDLSLVSVSTYGLSPVTPSDTTGFKSVLLEFIGEYDPVIVEYEYQNTNGYNSYLREVQPDYVWLASCGMLALFVLSLFKLGGAILCRR